MPLNGSSFPWSFIIYHYIYNGKSCIGFGFGGGGFCGGREGAGFGSDRFTDMPRGITGNVFGMIDFVQDGKCCGVLVVADGRVPVFSESFLVLQGCFEKRARERVKAGDCPLGRPKAVDVARAVAFLIENESVTGVDVPVNGGLSVSASA